MTYLLLFPLPLLLTSLLPPLATSTSSSLSSYLTLRSLTLQQNTALSFSHSTTLNPEETTASTHINSLLQTYIKESRASHNFPPTTFFHEWNITGITESPLYDVVERMPKGGALHLHSGSSGSTQWIVDEGVLLPDCYVYWGEEDDSLCIDGMTGEVRGCEEPNAQKLLKVRERLCGDDESKRRVNEKTSKRLSSGTSGGALTQSPPPTSTGNDRILPPKLHGPSRFPLRFRHEPLLPPRSPHQ